MEKDSGFDTLDEYLNHTNLRDAAEKDQLVAGFAATLSIGAFLVIGGMSPFYSVYPRESVAALEVYAVITAILTPFYLLLLARSLMKLYRNFPVLVLGFPAWCTRDEQRLKLAALGIAALLWPIAAIILVVANGWLFTIVTDLYRLLPQG